MKKIIASAALIFALLAGTVSGSSINGEYDGFPIVKIKQGLFKDIETEVPAFIYNGNTMVPMAALREMGLTVRWNPETYTVSVTVPKSDNPSIDLLMLADVLKDNKVGQIEFLASSEKSFTRLDFEYTGSFSDEDFEKNLHTILFWFSLSDASVFQIHNRSGIVLWTYSNFVADYIDEKITFSELMKNHMRGASIPSQSGLSAAPTLSTPVTSDAIESTIEGDFEGFDDEQIFKLDNGQIWQQDEFKYHYHYAYRPSVTIYKSGFSYYMIVEGVTEKVKVKRLK